MTRQRATTLPADDWRGRDPGIPRTEALAKSGTGRASARVGERHGRPAGQVAIAWVLRHAAVTGAIVGGRNARQVEQTVGASDLRLTEREISQIEGVANQRRQP